MKRLGDQPMTFGNCFPLQNNALLSNTNRYGLQDIICSCDQTNGGISRKEAIIIISDTTQARLHKQAENHLDYLIQKKKLTQLKKGDKCNCTGNNNQIKSDQYKTVITLALPYHI